MKLSTLIYDNHLCRKLMFCEAKCFKGLHLSFTLYLNLSERWWPSTPGNGVHTVHRDRDVSLLNKTMSYLRLPRVPCSIERKTWMWTHVNNMLCNQSIDAAFLLTTLLSAFVDLIFEQGETHKVLLNNQVACKWIFVGF